ncbi:MULTISPECIES: hypothetical protein [unclassified Streptomyces]|uniref:hypothetical protein n=1 Tax=unclassified Streptomyces TaxID=2593676 RepID=UPI00380B044D
MIPTLLAVACTLTVVSPGSASARPWSSAPPTAPRAGLYTKPGTDTAGGTASQEMPR